MTLSDFYKAVEKMRRAYHFSDEDTELVTVEDPRLRENAVIELRTTDINGTVVYLSRHLERNEGNE